MGYKDQGRPSTYGQVALFAMIPASTTGVGPDSRYLPILKRGTRFTSQNGLNFVLLGNVDFSAPGNPIVVARTDASTGAPTHFAVKAYGNVVSGFFTQKQISVGAYQRFLRLRIPGSNISEIPGEAPRRTMTKALSGRLMGINQSSRGVYPRKTVRAR